MRLHLFSLVSGIPLDPVHSDLDAVGLELVSVSLHILCLLILRHTWLMATVGQPGPGQRLCLRRAIVKFALSDLTVCRCNRLIGRLNVATDTRFQILGNVYGCLKHMVYELFIDLSLVELNSDHVVSGKIYHS